MKYAEPTVGVKTLPLGFFMRQCHDQAKYKWISANIGRIYISVCTIFVLYACVLAARRKRDTILAHFVSISFRIVLENIDVYFFGLGFAKYV
jgi:hypothetical protein